MHLHLFWHAPLLLAIGTWLVYVADRLLDGSRPWATTRLRARHHFHSRHRTTFLTAAGAAVCLLIWLIVTHMKPEARHEDTVLFSAALLYLVAVHKPQLAKNGRLPKELAVGVVFACATAVPAWSRLNSGRATLLPAVGLFAGLCWLNCVAIERWESPRCATLSPILSESHPTTRWAANRFRGVLLSFGGVAAILAILQPHATTPIYLAMMIAAACLAFIDANRERFSTLGLRIAADAALLTPVLFLPFLS